MRLFVSVYLISVAIALQAQTEETAKQIYATSQDSIFLIYLNDVSGSTTALGSGFLISPRTVITNAHVVEAGEPVLAIGPVRIPLKIVAVDKDNDLAELSMSADLTSKPLKISSETVAPGEHIFAIGNPEGLEKTISEGIVSGVRSHAGRSLIQITSPISHGSSGGPILNSKGEVVGVAVGMLQDGQNLNFAVPIEYVTKLMARKPEESAPFDLQENLTAEAALMEDWQKASYSTGASSDYELALAKAVDGLRSIVTNTSDSKALVQAACYGTKAEEFSDLGIEAARNLAKVHPSAENQALLAYVLYDRAQDESLAAFSAKTDSEEERAALARKDKFLAEAASVADRALHDRALHDTTGNAFLLAAFVLGSVKGDKGEYADETPLLERVTRGDGTICEVDFIRSAYQNLIVAINKMGHPDETEKWFQAYATKYQPFAYEWDNEGDRRAAANDFGGAARAYEKAAPIAAFDYDYCYASANRYLETPSDADALLADGRACIEASTRNADKEKAKNFDRELPFVYQYMAAILHARGVYQQALEYAKQSIDLKPDNAFAYDTEADIFSDLQQYAECIAAAQNAIRASDGKYPFMHFALGNCYFSTQNWAMAANSFKIAAEADKTDASSAFNLGLSYLNEERRPDAMEWFREALRRNPDTNLKERILKFLQE